MCIHFINIVLTRNLKNTPEPKSYRMKKIDFLKLYNVVSDSPEHTHKYGVSGICIYLIQSIFPVCFLRVIFNNFIIIGARFNGHSFLRSHHVTPSKKSNTSLLLNALVGATNPVKSN